MCGIAGKVCSDRADCVDAGLIERMTETIRHRGPDDGGVWVNGPVGLGNRRLSIIDLSPRGHQPMSNEDGSVWIAFNGEIYNFAELRAELAAQGHLFRSDTDTETIVHLYERDGLDCVKRLRGMFAFAIWDAPRRRLFAARDRLGKKPFFYYSGRDGLLFASEPKAILQDPGVPREVDAQAIRHYLTYGYVPSPWSAFRGLRKLPPAHYLLFENGRVDVRGYWTLRYQPKRTAPEAALADELLALLEQSVRLRLVSDVPLGALLSGGVDSSAVVALMRRVSPAAIRTFSIGFEHPEYDEIAYARRVAEHLHTEHHQFTVRPDAVALLPRIVWHYNEPFADSSAVPSFAVCEMARREVTVALNGDGGDEVFLGYDRYVAANLSARFDGLPRAARKAASALLAPLPLGTPKSSLHRLRRFAEVAALPANERYARWITLFDGDSAAQLLAPEFARATAGPAFGLLDEALRQSDGSSPAERASHADVQMYLPDDLLVKMDIASMAHSLEVRSPLLDHHVLEFAAALPAGLKLHGMVQKYLLKRVMRDALPESILSRRKMGFGVPIDRWFRNELRDLARDTLLDQRATARGYFRKAAVQRLLDEHDAGTAHHHARLWSLLMLELWHRMFIDQPCPAAAPASI
jgi:asparagine synthase (glutamine-hydrolysing)